jgi:hypothetical protein
VAQDYRDSSGIELYRVELVLNSRRGRTLRNQAGSGLSAYAPPPDSQAVFQLGTLDALRLEETLTDKRAGIAEVGSASFRCFLEDSDMGAEGNNNSGTGNQRNSHKR